jgi:hypothetical protein
MSAKVKSSKKSVPLKEETPLKEENHSDTEVKAEVKAKKSSKKSSKKQPEPEKVDLVSDSDKSFIEALGKPDNIINNIQEIESDNEYNVKLIDVTTSDTSDINTKIYKMIIALNRKLIQINTKYEFEQMTDEDQSKILDSINQNTLLNQILLKKYYASLSGKKLEEKELKISTGKKTKERKEKVVTLDEDGNEIKKISNYDKERQPYDEVCDFLDIPRGSLVSSRTVEDGLKKFISEKHNEGIENNVTGKLKTLLEFIIPNRHASDDSIPNVIPDKINNNKHIKTYSAYSFPKKDDTKSKSKKVQEVKVV